MRIVLPVNELQAPWIIDEDILSEHGAPLVLRGAAVTEALKNAMLRHGIISVRVRSADEHAPASKHALPAGLILKVRQDVQKLVLKTVRERAISSKLLSEVTEQTALLIDALFSGETPVFSELRSLSNYDAYTYEHSWSVMLFSVVLSRIAWEDGLVRNLDYTSRLNLGMGAVLHDIGKTLIPPSVLNKAGALDEKEWEQMRLHPQYGFDLLRPYNLIMPMIRAIVAFHHLRPDGNGYGLAKGKTLEGDAIPRLVRIVSIADAYDAMTSSRPYQKGRLPFEALAIIVAGAGSQFDPGLVPLMERIVVPFPEGSLLFLKDGTVASVQLPGGLGEHHQRPECSVVASFAGGGQRKPGETFILRDQSVIALGAASPEDLLIRVLAEIFGKSSTFKGNMPLTLHSALPVWRELFQNALEKVNNDRMGAPVIS